MGLLSKADACNLLESVLISSSTSVVAFTINEAIHLFFVAIGGISTTVIVFFLNRFLKKKEEEWNKIKEDEARRKDIS